MHSHHRSTARRRTFQQAACVYENGLMAHTTPGDILARMTHVTHTHSASADVWPIAFTTLDRYARHGLGLNVVYVACTDVPHRDLSQWPWLRVVVYGRGSSLYGRKVAACLSDPLVARTEFVLHTMEDMVLAHAVQWALVAAAVRILERSPLAIQYVRFGGPTHSGNISCSSLLPGFLSTQRLAVTRRRDQALGIIGNACESPYFDVFGTNVLSVARRWSPAAPGGSR